MTRSSAAITKKNVPGNFRRLWVEIVLVEMMGAAFRSNSSGAELWEDTSGKRSRGRSIARRARRRGALGAMALLGFGWGRKSVGCDSMSDDRGGAATVNFGCEEGATVSTGVDEWVWRIGPNGSGALFCICPSDGALRCTACPKTAFISRILA